MGGNRRYGEYSLCSFNFYKYEAIFIQNNNSGFLVKPFSPLHYFHSIVFPVSSLKLLHPFYAHYSFENETSFPPLTVAPKTNPALINTKFLIMYCPSKVKPYGKTVHTFSGKMISGNAVPGI